MADRCPNCRGTGTVRIEQTGGGYNDIACPLCLGSGTFSNSPDLSRVVRIGGSAPGGRLEGAELVSALASLAVFIAVSLVLNLWITGVVVLIHGQESSPAEKIALLSMALAVTLMLVDSVGRAFLPAFAVGGLLYAGWAFLLRHDVNLPFAMALAVGVPLLLWPCLIASQWSSKRASKLGIKGAMLGAIVFWAVWQVAKGYYHTDGSSRNAFYYAVESGKAGIRYFAQGGAFVRERVPPEQVVICEPAYFDASTRQEVLAPPHLQQTYASMEQNLQNQIRRRSGHLYAEIHIALATYRHPVVVFIRNPPHARYDYDYRVIGLRYVVNQDCARLTPAQTGSIVTRQRGEPIPVSRLGL